MKIALYMIAGLMCLGVLLIVRDVGKPRKPVTPGAAAFLVAWNAVLITVLVLAARELH